MLDKKIIQKVETLYLLYKNGKVSGPEQHEVNPGLPKDSRQNYLYFTLPCCINFQRSSPAMWASALSTYSDPETNYLFFPEKVVQRSHDDVKAGLIKHKLALQTHKHPMIWGAISETLYKYYDSDPRRVLSESGHDVIRLIETLQKTKKDIFPYLGGAKLSNYWLFILDSFTDVKLKNLNEISIIPDTHVIKSTINLGLATEGVQAAEVESVWRKVLKETGISPTEMHSALWRWSRNGFSPDLVATL